MCMQIWSVAVSFEHGTGAAIEMAPSKTEAICLALRGLIERPGIEEAGDILSFEAKAMEYDEVAALMMRMEEGHP